MNTTRRSIMLTAAALCQGAWVAGLGAITGKDQRRKERSWFQRFLASHKLPPAAEGSIVSHRGWIYELRPDRFILARRLGERPAGQVSTASARGEMVWFRFVDGAWRAMSPARRTRPEGNETYFQSHELPAEWAARILGPGANRAMDHFFTVLQCEMTPDGSPEAIEPASWELGAWYENALVVEALFRAGKLG